ncbi:class I SAM-dependent methyltransferase [Psychrobacillus sp. MER TA 171]|uniref:class I SAM-dependent methyltransferase n=1 Tax=Psychrobacillus sp. MER TA 171 TaxID=2939577 RepID=UPI00203A4EFE|nr:class I SAM-dependent methyltransferase [Psychrobacillus sp. MER TA 171]MCM3356521.1 class I SAM-dependent methyltransferase [Psychrobacillus sp. MER TA 171]
MSNKLEFDHKTAAEYDKGIRRNLPTYDPMLRLSQTFLRANLKEEASLLVVGGGGGNELNAFGPSNTEWKFTVVDPSTAMLEVAKMKVEQLDMNNRVDFFNGTIEIVPPDYTFDAATCILVLHFVPDVKDKLALLKQIRAHLKPGSPFILVSKYGDPNSLEFKELVNLWKNYWLDTTNLSEEKVEELMNATLTESSISEEEIRGLLSEAGFHRIANFFKTNHFGGWICHAL